MTAIHARSVTRTFGEFTAVDDVDLDVGPGEVVGLLGANGAGKTTLIKMLLGLVTPSSGTVRLFGEPPSRRQRSRIGYVPQNLGLYPDLTAAENLAFRTRVFGNGSDGRGSRERREAAGPAGDGSLGDGPVGDGPVGRLSLGVQRRVAFEAAIGHHPDLLVLDEPTSGVSPLARSGLWDLIRTRADAGAAVLVSTHYMEEASQADRVVVMTRGRVVAEGPVAGVVGGRVTVEVTAERWAEAFAVLDGGDRRVMLAGRRIRVLGDGVDTVRAVLDAAGIVAEVRLVPATLDETMVELSA